MVKLVDTNEDGYDDVCYEAGAESGYSAGFDIGAMSGDSNLDGTLDILDIVYFIDVILNP